MVFKRLLGALGVGGPAVDTVLDPGPVLPGGTLSGRVHLRGGGSDVEVEHLGLELIARVEAEYDEGESTGTVAFERFTVGGGFRLAAEEERSVPFQVAVPWETPVTELHGRQLGVVLGVRTELAVAGARDKGDLDPLAVRPLPVQEAVLDAFGRLGFGFRSADLELGRIGGTGQRLPFYQEIELIPPAQYAHAVHEIELTFLATPEAVEVVLEADRRGGPFTAGHDALSRFTVRHEDVSTVDWAAEVDGWVRRLAEHREAYATEAAYLSDAYHSPGSGAGTALAAGAAGLAAGVVGGLVAAEVVDEIGDFFEGEDEGGDD
ncbi:sporulation protein [Streptomyces echinoruber]|uniref:Sporulation protein n=1 Tax=Streptomyces echinoruber TaxID=68898 RepID=A0A918RJD6_9ACTN|nr:sporulation protein [Streptomyces echinoruber]GGZ99713.1 sporulation protein [Streptomyces echinoruber]